MYIKWQYKWFGNKFLFFVNSPSDLTFWITYVLSCEGSNYENFILNHTHILSSDKTKWSQYQSHCWLCSTMYPLLMVLLFPSLHSLHYSSCHFAKCIFISMSVTTDGVWIGNWIYWTLTDLSLQVIITVSLIHRLHSSLEHALKSSQPAVSPPVFW
jgi:hypothetical protein